MAVATSAPAPRRPAPYPKDAETARPPSSAKLKCVGAQSAEGGLVALASAGSALERLAQAAVEASVPLCVTRSVAELASALSGPLPLAIAIDATARAAEEACLRIRCRPELARIPIIGMRSQIGDLAFEELYGWGGDDIARSYRPSFLVRRLSAIGRAKPEPTIATRKAIVVDPDRRQRVLLARVLRNAGYDVDFAVDGAEALKAVARPEVELVVSASLYEEGQRGFVSVARSLNVGARWVIAAAPREQARIRGAMSGMTNVAVWDAYSPPDNILFVANEMVRRQGIDARSSARVLYGTSVRFRSAGSDEDEVGYSYNLSRDGLYVRTLAPLPSGTEVWVEFRPPRCERRVRLEGKVAWTRGYGTSASATVPPGFGLKITGGSDGDNDRLARGYQSLEAQQNGTN